MCKQLVIPLIVLASFKVSGQSSITGRVTDMKLRALEGVSISIRDSYDGTTSGKDGSYSFTTSNKGRLIILFTMTGFKSQEKEIIVSQGITEVNVQLREEISDLKAVVIAVATFEAGDKKRTTVLKSVDMVTTAGQQADIVAALKTLPGTQQVGEQEGLFVRGGTNNETKVFIDGMMVTNPFFSSVPGIAQRSRFSPLLFKGTSFSSGGYSAQYGQGLSSVLILESIDLPSRSEVNLIISSPQLSFLGQNLNKRKNTSMGVNVNYMNLAPYFDVVPQKYHHTKAPEAFNSEFNFRKKTKNGMLKFFTYGSTNKTAFERADLDVAGSMESFSIRNYNILTNLTYMGSLQNHWQLYAGSSFSFNEDNVDIRRGSADTSYFVFRPNQSNRTFQSKTIFTKNFSGLTKLYLGGEFQKIADHIEAEDSIELRKIDDQYFAGFIEGDIYFSSRFVSRAGVRFEYSTLLQKTIASPRLSIAYKINGHSQFSFAFGTFYQKPETNYLLRIAALDFTKANHYIFNFQKVQNGQTLRIESFYKQYQKLLTSNPDDPFNITNNGSGYAKGAELFWRDRTTIKNLDYWISYSFLHTRRKYLDYPAMVQPSFASKHTFNAAAKRWVNVISTQFSATYTYASGRPYYNPNKAVEDFMSEKTMDYHSLGLQANYLKTFGNINAVFIVNISNALGNRQVFGYRFSSKATAEGKYVSDAVTPMARRFIFIGAYLSIGSDKRKSILD